jgi:hypothetical protein
VRRVIACLGLAIAIGCSGGDDAPAGFDTPIPDRSPPDAGPDGAPDAAPQDGASSSECDVTKPFGAPVALAELNTPDEDVLSDMSADELTAYVSTNHGVTGVHLFYATRAKRGDPFGPLTSLFPSGSFDDWGVAVSPDALTAVVSSNRGGNSDLYVATRPNTWSAFGALGAASATNTAEDEQGPKWAADGKTLYFDSTRSGSRDLYRSTATGGSFGAPEAIKELNSADLDAVPVLSPDELTIYFVSTRAPTPDGDVYVAKRASRSDPFGAPVAVAEVNDDKAVDAAAFVSADGCRLYMTSSRNGGHYDIYLATRPR